VAREREGEVAMKVTPTDSHHGSAAGATNELTQKLSAAEQDAFASHCR